MSKIKKLAGETMLYGLGSIVPRALNFLLVPLHTRIFFPEQYGVITNLLAFVGFLNLVYLFGMETAYFRFATQPGADQKRIYNLVQTIVLGIGLVLSVIFIACARPIAAMLQVEAHPEFIVWLVLVLMLDSTVAIPFARLRLEKRPLLFATAKISSVLLILGLNYYFLIINYDPGIGVGSVFLATLLGNSIYLIIFARYLLSWRPVYDYIISSKVFVYAFPVMLTGLAGMTNEMFSRLTLMWWLPPGFYGTESQSHALGVFGASYKYAVLMSVSIQAFRYAAEPFFFSNAADKTSPDLFARVNHFFVIACCVLWLGVSVNMDILKYINPPSYWSGVGIVPILLLAYLFLGVYYNFSVWFKVTDKTYVGTIITGVGALLTILLNFILVPIGGYYGSSWAALLVYAFMAIACYWWGQKYYPIPYKVLADGAYIVCTGLVIYAVSFVTIDHPWTQRIFHLAVVVVYIGVVYFLETGRAIPVINKAPENNT